MNKLKYMMSLVCGQSAVKNEKATTGESLWQWYSSRNETLAEKARQNAEFLSAVATPRHRVRKVHF